MELTVLGCSGSYGAPGRVACSGYLVRDGDTAIWMDCGNGTFANLQQHVDPAGPRRGRDHPRAPRPLRRHLRAARAAALRARARRPAGVRARRASTSGSGALVATGATPSTGTRSTTANAPTVGDSTLAVLADRPPAAHVRGRGRRDRRPAAGLHRRHRARLDASTRSRPAPTSCCRRRRTSTPTVRRRSTCRRSRPGAAAREAGRAAAGAHPPLAPDRPGGVGRGRLRGVRRGGHARRGRPHRHRI